MRSVGTIRRGVGAGKEFQSRVGGIDPKRFRGAQRASTGGDRATLGAQINHIEPSAQRITKLRAVQFGCQVGFKIEPVGLGLNSVAIALQPHDRHAVARQNIIARAPLGRSHVALEGQAIHIIAIQAFLDVLAAAQAFVSAKLAASLPRPSSMQPGNRDVRRAL